MHCLLCIIEETLSIGYRLSDYGRPIAQIWRVLTAHVRIEASLSQKSSFVTPSHQLKGLWKPSPPRSHIKTPANKTGRSSLVTTGGYKVYHYNTKEYIRNFVSWYRSIVTCALSLPPFPDPGETGVHWRRSSGHGTRYADGEAAASTIALFEDRNVLRVILCEWSTLCHNTQPHRTSLEAVRETTGHGRSSRGVLLILPWLPIQNLLGPYFPCIEPPVLRASIPCALSKKI